MFCIFGFHNGAPCLRIKKREGSGSSMCFFVCFVDGQYSQWNGFILNIFSVISKAYSRRTARLPRRRFSRVFQLSFSCVSDGTQAA